MPSAYGARHNRQCIDRFDRLTCNAWRTRCTGCFTLFPQPCKYLVRDYESQQSRTVGTEAVSRMLSTHLYYRRSFPFYTFNIVGGLDAEGAVARVTVVSWVLEVLGVPTPCVGFSRVKSTREGLEECSRSATRCSSYHGGYTLSKTFSLPRRLLCMVAANKRGACTWLTLAVYIFCLSFAKIVRTHKRAMRFDYIGFPGPCVPLNPYYHSRFTSLPATV